MDLQSFKNSKALPTTTMSSKLGSKPTDLIRDESIESTATPCRCDDRVWGEFFSLGTAGDDCLCESKLWSHDRIHKQRP